jgi:hypothetical protein
VIAKGGFVLKMLRTPSIHHVQINQWRLITSLKVKASNADLALQTGIDRTNSMATRFVAKKFGAAWHLKTLGFESFLRNLRGATRGFLGVKTKLTFSVHSPYG